MAPGIGGNGSGGGGGRQTGTVPKTKSHNESTREYNGASRRDYQHFNHMPNNLIDCGSIISAGLEPTIATLFLSCRSGWCSDDHMAAETETSSLDWQPVNDSLPHTRTRKESNTSASRYSEFDAEENTVSQDNLWFNSAQRSQAYNSDDDEVSQASWAENRYKSNNLGLPDKSQVATRLHQIRDYVSQTMSMMDSLRATGGQRNMAQHNKLANMLEGLRDSELKLQTLYERLQRIPPPPNTEGDPESFSAHQMLESPRERANKPGQSTSKPSETARRNELKKQVQVSQLKLQELQEQQATLKALRQKAQEQLNEARAAQGVLMSAHGINPDNNIQERLQNLHRFFDARHQLVQVVQGLDEEELETCEMQNKLDELQAKKQHMYQLLAQFSNNISVNISLLVQVVQGLDEEELETCEMQNKLDELQAKKQHMDQLLALFSNNISGEHQSAGPGSTGLDEEELETCEMQNKLDELQAKKQHMDQLLAQFSNNISREHQSAGPGSTGLDEEELETCEMQNKLDELQAKKQHMDQLLAQFSNNISREHQSGLLQLVQVVQGLDEEELETCEMQNKLDELQAKKQHMDQLLAQFSNNISEDLSAEECERDVENKMAELNAMRDTLAILQSNISAQLQPQASQERSVKKEPQSRASVEKSNTTTGQTLMAKTQQLHEAKAKLQQLQNLLRTVEELRESGQPVPDSILQLMGNSHLSDHSSSPTHPDRSDMSSQELNVTQPVGERLVNACERSELYSERGCRSLNSCERERVNHQLPANAAKHNNQEDKLGTKMQLEELLRNQDLNISQPLQSSSFQENSTTTGTWGSSTQGTSTMDDNFNLEFAGDLNESASIKNATGAVQPHNVWRKPSTGSGTSRLSWTSPYVPQDVRRQQHSDTGARPRTSPPPPHSPPTTRPHPAVDTTLQPDSHWVVQQISQKTKIHGFWDMRTSNSKPKWGIGRGSELK
ncbi:Phosphoacetylglucosamine Mutase [Homalodisca vitripennis]|nr:Phosphoacetylglucosamine Mutase [Homalodisca vitripennis]